MKTKLLISLIAITGLACLAAPTNRQSIFLGTSANDHTGDPARIAGQKINDNFLELYLFAQTNISAGGTATNVTTYSFYNTNLPVGIVVTNINSPTSVSVWTGTNALTLRTTNSVVIRQLITDVYINTTFSTNSSGEITATQTVNTNLVLVNGGSNYVFSGSVSGDFTASNNFTALGVSTLTNDTNIIHGTFTGPLNGSATNITGVLALTSLPPGVVTNKNSNFVTLWHLGTNSYFATLELAAAQQRPGDVITVIGQNDVMNPVVLTNVTLMGYGATLNFYGTNVSSVPTCLNLSSNVSVYGITISNKAPGFFQACIGTEQRLGNPLATDFYIQDVKGFGDSDGLFFGTTNGFCNGSFVNCSFNSKWDCAALTGGGSGTFLFSGCSFTTTNLTTMGANGTRCFIVDGAYTNTFINCTFNSGNATNTTIDTCFVLLSAGSSNRLSGCTFNYFSTNTAAGCAPIAVSSASVTLIQNCIIDGPTMPTAGIQISGSVAKTYLFNNIIYPNRTNQQIRFNTTGAATISGGNIDSTRVSNPAKLTWVGDVGFIGGYVPNGYFTNLTSLNYIGNGSGLTNTTVTYNPSTTNYIYTFLGRAGDHVVITNKPNLFLTLAGAVDGDVVFAIEATNNIYIDYGGNSVEWLTPSNNPTVSQGHGTLGISKFGSLVKVSFIEGPFNYDGSSFTNLNPANLSILTATNVLTVTAGGITNTTSDTYIFTATVGTGLSLKDGNGTTITTPILNEPIVLKPNWRFTGTTVTASPGLIISR